MPEKTLDLTGIMAAIPALRNRFRNAGACPECGYDMLEAFNPDTQKAMCKPACPNCGYRVNGHVTSQREQDAEFTHEANRSDAIMYLAHTSVLTDKDVLDKNFENFHAGTVDQQKALGVAKHVAKDIGSGQPVHAVFTGSTGVGKSHLAMGILYEVLKQSNYRKKVAFIDLQELIKHMKIGFGDDNEFARYNQGTMAEISKADVVVIDDLGSEAGDGSNNYSASQFNLDTVSGIFRARENKPTIITTNRVGVDLKRIYGDRVVSRITAHVMGHTMDFTGIKDYRMNH